MEFITFLIGLILGYIIASFKIVVIKATPEEIERIKQDDENE